MRRRGANGAPTQDETELRRKARRHAARAYTNTQGDVSSYESRVHFAREANASSRPQATHTLAALIGDLSPSPFAAPIATCGMWYVFVSQ